MSQLRLVVGSSCGHCVREVTRWLRDVRGAETVVADAGAVTAAESDRLYAALEAR
jgi:copper chaperone CopZ